MRASRAGSRASTILSAAIVIFLFIILWYPKSELGSQREGKGSSVTEPVLLNHAFALNRTKLATAIEPRPAPFLVPHILHFLATVPMDWPMQIFVSDQSKEMLEHSAAIRGWMATGRLILTVLEDIQNGFVNGEAVSKFLTSRKFWDSMDPKAEYVFFFQSDSMICSRSTQTLDDWLGYDWVGSPWNYKVHKNLIKQGGNGGFSMRKRSSILAVLDSFKRKPGEAEDLWFIQNMMKLGLNKFPEHEHEKNFGVETMLVDEPLGFHKGGTSWHEMWAQADTMDQITTWCPEVKLFLQGDMRDLREWPSPDKFLPS